MISKKWKKMADIYKRFAPLMNLDFSSSAEIEMYNYESKGGIISDKNGFFWGKKWMDITISMWKEDIKLGNLSKLELINDNYPIWFLLKVGI